MSLKSTFGSPIALWICSSCKGEYSIADTESSDAASDLDNLTGQVCSDDEGIADPGGHQVTDALNQTVEGIDRDGAVADQDLVWARRRIGRGADAEGRPFGWEPE